VLFKVIDHSYPLGTFTISLATPLPWLDLSFNLAGHTVNDHNTNDYIRRELQTECILDKIDEYRMNWLLHLQRMPQHRIPLKSYHTVHKEREHLGDRRIAGESSCNCGDGTGQMAQPLMFMMMIMMIIIYII
jgi:hypothetical protein